MVVEANTQSPRAKEPPVLPRGPTISAPADGRMVAKTPPGPTAALIPPTSRVPPVADEIVWGIDVGM